LSLRLTKLRQQNEVVEGYALAIIKRKTQPDGWKERRKEREKLMQTYLRQQNEVVEG
jgi:hypothetical protein